MCNDACSNLPNALAASLQGYNIPFPIEDDPWAAWRGGTGLWEVLETETIAGVKPPIFWFGRHICAYRTTVRPWFTAQKLLATTYCQLFAFQKAGVPSLAWHCRTQHRWMPHTVHKVSLAQLEEVSVSRENRTAHLFECSSCDQETPTTVSEVSVTDCTLFAQTSAGLGVESFSTTLWSAFDQQVSECTT